MRHCVSDGATLYTVPQNLLFKCATRQLTQLVADALLSQLSYHRLNDGDQFHSK